jgi:hypothetical protein
MFNPSTKQAMSEKDTVLNVEELAAIYDCWWNTSAGLRARFPGIEHSAEWTQFSEIYDQTKFQKVRVKDWITASPGFTISSSLMKLRALAERALNQKNHGPDLLNGVSPEVAGKRLAKTILGMLSEGNERSLEEFATDALATIKAKLPQNRNNRDLIWAMLQFMEREKKLPRKKELSIEAMRLARLVRVNEKNPSWIFGVRVKIRSSYYRIYSESYVCPESEWEKPRWEKGDFTDPLEKCGLQGLGEFK